MKETLMISRTLTLLAALASLSFGGHAIAHGDDHAVKYGGIVVATKAMDFEVVAKPESIQLYLSEHGKVVNLAGAKAKVTLLNGAEKTELELMPAGEKLEAKGTFKVQEGTRGIASVTLVGKPAAVVRFEIK